MDPSPQNNGASLYFIQAIKSFKKKKKKDMLGKAMVGALTSSNSPDFKL